MWFTLEESKVLRRLVEGRAHLIEASLHIERQALACLLTNAVLLLAGWRSFKSLESASRPATVARWLRFWVLHSLFAAGKAGCDAAQLGRWVPLYYEVCAPSTIPHPHTHGSATSNTSALSQACFALVLWLAFLGGEQTIYTAVLQPYLAAHAPVIDRRLQEADDKGGGGLFISPPPNVQTRAARSAVARRSSSPPPRHSYHSPPRRSPPPARRASAQPPARSPRRSASRSPPRRSARLEANQANAQAAAGRSGGHLQKWQERELGKSHASLLGHPKALYLALHSALTSAVRAGGACSARWERARIWAARLAGRVEATLRSIKGMLSKKTLGKQLVLVCWILLLLGWAAALARWRTARVSNPHDFALGESAPTGDEKGGQHNAPLAALKKARQVGRSFVHFLRGLQQGPLFSAGDEDETE